MITSLVIVWPVLEPFQYEFVQRGLWEVLLLSGSAGVIGTWIVLRGLAFYAHAIGTAAFSGLVLQWLHICPIMKRIWTSSYTLYSGGLVILMLAGFYALIEWKGWRRWSFPLLVIGANSITIYVMSWTM